MAIQPAHYRFTREDFHRMAETGILAEDARVELIDGEIFEMSPIGRRHKACVDRVSELFFAGVQQRAIVRVQSSVALAERVEPQPDIALLRRAPDYYAAVDETVDDILLLIEVADSSEGYDRLTKAPLYAHHGVRELWIVNLQRDQVVVYREPAENGYTTTRVYRRGESISPLAFPDLEIAVNDSIG
jgi:Uma2 family endonuclease